MCTTPTVCLSRSQPRYVTPAMDSLSSLAERSKALTTGGPVRIKRDLAQLLDDALLLATASAGPTLPGDVVNRAQRLLLSEGGFDVDASTRESRSLTLKVGVCLSIPPWFAQSRNWWRRASSPAALRRFPHFRRSSRAPAALSHPIPHPTPAPVGTRGSSPRHQR